MKGSTPSWQTARARNRWLCFRWKRFLEETEKQLFYTARRKIITAGIKGVRMHEERYSIRE